MRLARLKRVIEGIPPIPDPRVDLEQYTSPPEIALAIASHLVNSTNIDGATIADLGAGTCRLSIPLLLLGAGRVVAVDIDGRLAPLCIGAAEDLGVGGGLQYIVSAIRRRGPLAGCSVDIVVTNPPFGVHRRGADWEVLSHALEASRDRVYAVVKSGNIDYHARVARRYGYNTGLVATRWFPIPASMEMHRSRVRRVRVDVILFEREDGCTRRGAGSG
ncbi:MAG: methyltransferase [Desulfurococcales archaeon]|nr:methyltransferase [Desulfurococcales archaeon]